MTDLTEKFDRAVVMRHFCNGDKVLYRSFALWETPANGHMVHRVDGEKGFFVAQSVSKVQRSAVGRHRDSSMFTVRYLGCSSNKSVMRDIGRRRILHSEVDLLRMSSKVSREDQSVDDSSWSA
jgi:hypothetical protein